MQSQSRAAQSRRFLDSNIILCALYYTIINTYFHELSSRYCFKCTHILYSVSAKLSPVYTISLACRVEWAYTVKQWDLTSWHSGIFQRFGLSSCHQSHAGLRTQTDRVNGASWWTVPHLLYKPLTNLWVRNQNFE